MVGKSFANSSIDVFIAFCAVLSLPSILKMKIQVVWWCWKLLRPDHSSIMLDTSHSYSYLILGYNELFLLQNVFLFLLISPYFLPHLFFRSKNKTFPQGFKWPVPSYSLVTSDCTSEKYFPLWLARRKVWMQVKSSFSSIWPRPRICLEAWWNNSALFLLQSG